MANRLGELRSKAAISTPLMQPQQMHDPFQAFWDQFTQIQTAIFEIDETVNVIAQLDDEISSCFDERESSNLRAEMNSKMKTVPIEGNKIRNQLDSLRNSIKNLSTNPNSASEYRIQQNHLHLLDDDFASAITRFTRIQGEVKNKFRDQVVRQSRIAGNELDPKHVEEMLDKDPDYFKRNIFQISSDSATRQAASLYTEIYNRHQDIVEIDRALNELLEVFVQFSIIVKDQGRQIDNIEQNISQAKEYVAQARVELETAAVHQKKSRKCLYWIIGIAVCILVVIIVVIVFVV